MPDPRVASIRAAHRTTRQLNRLFARLGTSEHPRGRILTAYRNAHRALRNVYRRKPRMMELEVAEVLGGLRREVESTAREMLADAAALGELQARTEIEAWGLRETGLRTDTSPYFTAWLSAYDQQERRARALVVTESDPALILGDGLRVGVLSPSPVVEEGTRWLTTAAMMALVGIFGASIGRDKKRWGKQAIPVFDIHTTDCCLRVAGQVVPFDGKFHLTGTPRFADHQDWSPFHWHCRTSVAMVPLTDADDDLTRRIESDAVAERERRRLMAERVREVQEQLVVLGAMPDSIRRKDDTKEMLKLRRELLKLRKVIGYGKTGS